MREIKRHVIHCSDTPAGRHTTVEDIDGWHGKRGFHFESDQTELKHIGYHFVIYVDGTIHAGRPVTISGAHAKGYNSTSIGTCVIGNGHPNEKQRIALKQLDRAVRMFFGPIETLGHCQLPGVTKTCPNFDVKKLLKES